MVEASFEVSEEVANGRRPVTLVRGAIGLEIVDADFRGGVQIPTRVSPEWLDVAVVASGLAAEQRVAATCCRGIEATGRRLRRRNCELVELKGLQLGSDDVAVRIDVRQISKAMGGRNRELRCVVQSGIPESALSMHFQIRNEGIPVGNGSPAAPGVEVDSAKSKRWRDQRSTRNVCAGYHPVSHLLGIESLAVEK